MTPRGDSGRAADPRHILDQLDQAPTDPYEYRSWRMLREESVPTLTAAVRAVLDLADELTELADLNIRRADEHAFTGDQLGEQYRLGRGLSYLQAAEKVRAAVTAALTEEHKP